MVRVFAIAVAIIASVGLSACAAPSPKVYRHEQFRQATDHHHIIAIVPFHVEIMLKKLPDGVTAQDINDLELIEGRSFQRALYQRYLANRSDFNVECQDVDQTNVLLNQFGIEQKDIYVYEKKEIAQVLGVDAIISGWIERSKPRTTGEAIGIALLTGWSHPTNEVAVTMNIHDGTTSEIVWSFDHRLRGTVGSSSEMMVEALADAIGDRFPYAVTDNEDSEARRQ